MAKSTNGAPKRKDESSEAERLIWDRPGLGRRADRARWMIFNLETAIAQLDSADPRWKRRGEDFIDRAWRAVSGGVPQRGQTRNGAIFEAIVAALESTMGLALDKNGLEVFAVRESFAAARARYTRLRDKYPTMPAPPTLEKELETLLALAMRSLAGFVTLDRSALARAIEKWPGRSHDKWPAVADLARSMGWTGKSATLIQLVKEARKAHRTAALAASEKSGLPDE